MGIDRDEDTLPNGVESNTGTFVDGNDTGTSPVLADTDGDGFDDDVEVLAGTNPNNPFEYPGSVPVPALPGIGMAVLAGLMLIAAGVFLRRRKA
jgi:hypothetical protein